MPLSGTEAAGGVLGEAFMEMRLTDKERSRMQGMVKRPRSRKQLYRAEALLALDEGRPIEEVARQHRVGVDRVEGWVEAFSRKRLAFLAEPDAGRPSRGAEEDSDDEMDKETSGQPTPAPRLRPKRGA
jgi:hypothetical protein